jgi:isopentenyl-diphosphate delta-isomerase
MDMTELRKIDHLRICLEEAVEVGSTLFEHVHLVHRALPELDLSEVDPSHRFLGKRLEFPLLIAAMTGGCTEAKRVNQELARAAAKKGVAFGVGSQRAMIENEALADTFSVREYAPTILLLGNIGITALKRYPQERICRAVSAIEADALCVHINPAQELFQHEGDNDFSGCLAVLEGFCRSAPFPVIAKEVGNGMSRETAQSLERAHVSAIDVGGVGGTSWVLVDSLRSGKDSSVYRHWGIPTAASILEARVGLPLIATGGVRNGLEMAKAIALGADVCGIALPFLKILTHGGPSGVERYIDTLKQEFTYAMYLCGCKNIGELKQTPVVLTGELKEWCEQRGLGVPRPL